MSRTATALFHLRLMVTVVLLMALAGALIEGLVIIARHHGIHIPDGIVVGLIIGVGAGSVSWASKQIARRAQEKA